MKSRTHYYCPTPADRAIKQPLGERIQPGFDDCGVTAAAIKYCAKVQESFTNFELQKAFQNLLSRVPVDTRDERRGWAPLASERHKTEERVCAIVQLRSRVWTKASGKQATNDAFIRARDAAPERGPPSQLLLVAELDGGHGRRSPVHKRLTVCRLD